MFMDTSGLEAKQKAYAELRKDQMLARKSMSMVSMVGGGMGGGMVGGGMGGDMMGGGMGGYMGGLMGMMEVAMVVQMGAMGVGFGGTMGAMEKWMLQSITMKNKKSMMSMRRSMLQAMVRTMKAQVAMEENESCKAMYLLCLCAFLFVSVMHYACDLHSNSI